MSDIDTADHVLHVPSGEEWLTAFAKNGYLCACGWPCSMVPISDCQLIEKATPEKRESLLRQMAEMSGDDMRKRHAISTLAQSATLDLAGEKP